MKLKINALLLALVLILFAFSACKNYDASKYGHFERVGDLNVARAGHSATLLKDGRVLIAGGGTTTLEMYDPKTRNFSIVGQLREDHVGNGTALLPDGRVIFVAGPFSPDVEIYNPKNNKVTWEDGNCIQGKEHAITVLKDGTVLITGGTTRIKTGNAYYNPLVPNNSAEIFDPETGKCEPVGKMNVTRFEHHALLLPNGKVAIIGGDYFPESHPDHYTVEYYDAKTKSFTLSHKIKLVIRDSGLSILLNSGKILNFEGGGVAGGPSIPIEVIDPIRETVEHKPFRIGEARSYASYAMINNNTAFLFGGHMFNNAESLYDIPSNTFINLPGTRPYQYGASVTALKDGSILISGGRGSNRAELFVSTEKGDK